MLSFTKMNGAGNDFVMLDNRDRSLQLSGAQIFTLGASLSGPRQSPTSYLTDVGIILAPVATRSSGNDNILIRVYRCGRRHEQRRLA